MQGSIFQTFNGRAGDGDSGGYLLFLLYSLIEKFGDDDDDDGEKRDDYGFTFPSHPPTVSNTYPLSLHHLM